MDCYVTVQEYWKRLTTPVTELPLIVLVVTVTVLLPNTYIPPPCKGKEDFSGSTTLQRGDGRRFETVGFVPIAHVSLPNKTRASQIPNMVPPLGRWTVT